MQLGDCYDGRALDFARRLLETQGSDLADVNNASIGNQSNQMIIISVDMRLAPEHPFPCGVIDCLSATSAVIETLGSVHVGGESAGGNYTAVVAMECLRRYPEKIKR